MMACVTTPTMRTQQRTSSGQIQVIFGPMFSGKTTELMRRMKRFQVANYRCLIIKYANDIRYDKDGIATHDKQVLPAVSTTNLMSLTSQAMSSDIIGIDEGQFFADVVEFSELMADNGRTVIIAALDGTFQRQGFGDILKLIPLAESVVKLTAVCMVCYGEASFTKRKGCEKQVEVIGGADKYVSVCRACYKSPIKVAARCSPYNKGSEFREFTSGANATRQLFGGHFDEVGPTFEITTTEASMQS